MGVYPRQLKKGLRFFFSGMYRSQRYFSEAKFLTREEAVFAEKEFLAKFKEDTLAALTDARLEYLKSRSANNQYCGKTRSAFQKAKEAWGPDTPVTSVTKKMAYDIVQEVALDLQRRGLTPHQANQMIRALKAFFYYCRKVKDIEVKNPFQFMEMFPVSDKRKYIPKEEEIQSVYILLKSHEKLLFDFVDQSACRINEALRLMVEDINEEFVTLYTRKAKNSNLTPRVIPRPTCLQEIPAEGRVFSHWPEKEHPRFLGQLVRQLKEKGVVKEEWSWHNLRHRRASLWAKQRMPLIEIMTRLGHNNATTTMIYLHSLGFTAS